MAGERRRDSLLPLCDGGSAEGSVPLSAELGERPPASSQPAARPLPAKERFGARHMWQHRKRDGAKQGRVWIGSHCNVVNFNSSCKHVNLYFCKRI